VQERENTSRERRLAFVFRGIADTTVRGVRDDKKQRNWSAVGAFSTTELLSFLLLLLQRTIMRMRGKIERKKRTKKRGKKRKWRRTPPVLLIGLKRTMSW
jgi:hypothetical protein